MVSSIKNKLICTISDFNLTQRSGGVCKVKVFDSMLVYTSVLLIWYATWPPSEFSLPFIPSHRLRMCVRRDYVLAWCSLLNSLWYATWPFSEKVEFWPFDLTPSVGGRSLRVKYSLACCCICDSLKFDMQHDHVLKKLNFDLFNPVF